MMFLSIEQEPNSCKKRAKIDYTLKSVALLKVRNIFRKILQTNRLQKSISLLLN